MLNLTKAATLVKNSLVDTGSWIILITLTSPDEASILRICSNTADVTVGGIVYTAFPFELEELTESLNGDLPTLTLRVSNVNRLVQSYIETDPTLGSGWAVDMQIIYISKGQNYITYSEDFTQAPWIISNATTAVGVTSTFLNPRGLLSATEFTSSGTGTQSIVSQSYDFTGVDAFNFSVYFKQSQGDTDFNMDLYDTVAGVPIYSINLQSVANVITFLGTVSGTGIVGIEDAGEGWYRVNMAVSGQSVSIVDMRIRPSVNDNLNVNNIMIDGAQAGVALTDYVITEAAPLPDGILSEPELDVSFTSIQADADAEWVTFQIGMINPLNLRIPRLSFNGVYCQNTYKVGGCNYAGPLPTCAKSLKDCGDHFPGQANLPILAFPGVSSVLIYE